MSSSLYWKPAPKPEEDDFLGYQLKFYISEQLWDHDGSLCSEWTEIGEEWVPRLKLLTGKKFNKEVREEAQKTLDLIEKYGAIEVSLRM